MIKQRLKPSLSVHGTSQSAHGKDLKTVSGPLKKIRHMSETMNIIRNAKLKDAEQINSLHNKLKILEKKFDKGPLTNKEANIFSLNYFKKSIRNRNIKIIVAEEGKKIAGYILGIAEDSESFGPYLLKKKMGIVCDCFVEREYRKMGIGKLLMRELMKWFKTKKADTIELYVYTENENAAKFWAKIGFKNMFLIFRKNI